jgi:hypothetical protein
MGEMVNPSADDVYPLVDKGPSVLPDQGQEMHEHTPQPEAPVPTPWPEALEPCPGQQPPATHPLSRLHLLGLVMPQKPHTVVTTQGEAGVPRMSSAVDRELDREQQLLPKFPGGDRLPDTAFRGIHLPDVASDCLVGNESTRSLGAEEEIVVWFGIWSGS